MKHTKTRYDNKVGTGFIPFSTPYTALWTRGRFAEAAYSYYGTETIRYDTGSRFNRCAHVSTHTSSGYRAECAAFGTVGFDYRGGDLERDPETNPVQSAVMQYPSGTEVLEPTSAEVAGRRYDAYNRLIHANPGRHMNVLRSVMELKDTKQTMNGMIDFLKWGQRLKKGPFRWAGRLVTISSTIAEVASAYLTWSFGVEPTISDVKQFLREISQGKLRVKSRKPQVVAAKGSVLKAYYSARPKHSEILAAMYGTEKPEGSHSARIKLLPGRSSLLGYDSLVFGNKLPVPKRVTVRWCRGVYFAEVKESITIGELGDLKRRWEWSCPSFKTLWDLVPFSFLVDWFVDIGAFIERLEKRYVQQSFASSLSTVWNGEEWLTDSYIPKLQSFNVSVAGVERPVSPGYGGFLNLSLDYAADAFRESRSTSYDRKPDVVPNLVWPELVLPTRAYQISTGMALIARLANAYVQSR